MTHVPVYCRVNANNFLKKIPLRELIPLADEDGGTQWRSWLRYRATIQTVAGSIPDGVIGIFHWTNDQIVTEAATYTKQSNKGTNIHALSGIQTRDSGNGAAVGPCLRPHGHRDTP